MSKERVMPRGIRNNNPGNIDYNPANGWRGQLPHDPAKEPRFCRFDSPENGIRAQVKLTRNYQKIHGLNTPDGQIKRHAPSNENDTRAYIAVMKQRLVNAGFDGNRMEIDNPEFLSVWIKGIIQHENGQQPYSDAVINEGIRRAME